MISLLVSLALAASAAPAEVKARKGPVELKLQLESDKIAKDAKPHYRLVLTNVSKDPVMVRERLFMGELWQQTHQNARTGGVYLEVIQANGKPAKRAMLVGSGNGGHLVRPLPSPFSPLESFYLEPGQSTATVSGFSEVYTYALKPGRYKIRVGYDWSIRREQRPEWVEFKTPYLPFEVLK